MEQPLHDTPPIRVASESDQGELASMLAQAFDADPLTRWFVLDDQRRADRMERLFTWYLGHALPHGLSHTTADCNSVAVWLAHGQWNLSFFRQMHMLSEMVRVVGLRHLLSRLHGLNVFQRSHPKQPHYYLAVLGTAPARQGRGLGAAVLQPGLSRCDREQMPAYLETSAFPIIPFYERHGFRVCGDATIPHGGPAVRLMWREPQPPTRFPSDAE